MLTKSIGRKILLSLGLMALMQPVLAQTGSVAATVQLIPASEIMSAPMGAPSDPVESLGVAACNQNPANQQSAQF
ncbi:hypothetical protein, partial [Methylomonas koyamae]|uniref:hypothetical protein n=1 Tax=Methylomonas koyamae TaxID=702114 RepID=UPI0012F682B7